ncbi:MAG: hypothetical protein D3M94_01785 [Rhodocyclales bacterium GT-UBC]|nr:MAG: hypothetical protein D3M94_01785 [Rhodocyclales bacterium GT-UBC]
MKPPKILSWIAARNQISHELALKLWRRAAGEAEGALGECTSPRYYQEAIDRFCILADQESGASGPLPALWLNQLNLLKANLGAFERLHELFWSGWLAPDKQVI